MKSRRKRVERRFSLGEEVGQGAHSIVYKCRRSSGDSAYIAVKHFSSRAARDAATSPRAQEEFALARCLLSHDCIVRVLSLDLVKGCLSMEFVDGGSLEDVMAREGPLREERVIRVLCQVLKALALLHAHGCPHRDVKPANVLVETHTDTFKLSDWIGSEAEDLSLALGKPVGTPVFMAPEVAGCPHRHCFESDTVHTYRTHTHHAHTLSLSLCSLATMLSNVPRLMIGRLAQAREPEVTALEAYADVFRHSSVTVGARVHGHQPHQRPLTLGRSRRSWAHQRVHGHVACFAGPSPPLRYQGHEPGTNSQKSAP